MWVKRVEAGAETTACRYGIPSRIASLLCQLDPVVRQHGAVAAWEHTAERHAYMNIRTGEGGRGRVLGMKPAKGSLPRYGGSR